MRLSVRVLGAAVAVTFAAAPELQARGFGGFRGGAAFGPRGGMAYGGARGGAAFGPYGGFHAGGARGGTYVGPRGTEVQAGRIGGVARGPYGGWHAGGAEGARVTTPGGRTYTTGSRGGVGVGPYGGVHAHGASGAAYRGPYGGAAVGHRGGIAVGPYGGFASGWARGGVTVGPHGAVAVGHATRYVSPVALRTTGGYVRAGFVRPVFTPSWYRLHPAAWVPGRWRVPNFWVVPVWAGLATWCGAAALPIVYDYGSNVVINDNNVYVDGTQYATALQYAEQAIAFADRGRESKPADSDEWQPLGVFGLVQGEEPTAQNLFQLAVNKAGVVRGNYYDAVADNTLPVYGSVDAKSQRVAWSIGDKKNTVFEAGLNNLTQQQTTVLVHYGKDRTQQMTLVRLEEPKVSAK